MTNRAFTEEDRGPLAGKPERRLTRSTDLLRRAIDTQEERAAIYEQDGGERSAAQIATMFNAAKDMDVLTEADVFLILVLLKIVRDQKTTDGHEDSCLDLTSYASLFGEARLRRAGDKA